MWPLEAAYIIGAQLLVGVGRGDCYLCGMGIKGLWSILEPAGQPINSASLKGHRIAIDASIWMYQLSKALPPSQAVGEGYNPLVLAGLLKRICKLLHFGIRPLFVFDGGVPVLKAKTIVADISPWDGV